MKGDIMHRLAPIILVFVLAMGCTSALPPEVLQQYQARTLYTCCNLHYEYSDISDANYYVGKTLPLGTPVTVQSSGRGSVTFNAGGVPVTLTQAYGTAEESFQQYLDKILVAEDPTPRLASYSKAVQDAIRSSRVEPGMTREQVLLSLGYPPTHRTPSISSSEWTYWYNRWVTYKVQFDDTGTVLDVVGRPAPTNNQPVQ
jgi:hypothetical protein